MTRTAPDAFLHRHLGPSPADIQAMLGRLGLASLDALTELAIPEAIREPHSLGVPEGLGERAVLAQLAERAGENQVWRSYIGSGYHGTVTPPVILRNILENPGWYTAYTPYQAEIAQGRLEALAVFQTMVQDLTGFEVSNASLLDEATAAAEAMTMALRVHKGKAKAFFVDENVHPQTLDVVRTRALPLGIDVIVGDWRTFSFETAVFGALVQIPDTWGVISDPSDFCARAAAAGAAVVMATDLLALTHIKSPAECGAHIAVGSSQRFGVPMGFGGPHAAFLSTNADYARKMPGRIIGLSRDRLGNPGWRMSLQTREQHIRREKATSNVCTAQVLLAVIAAMYAVYHGPDGLSNIAAHTHARALALASALRAAGHKLRSDAFFDTITVTVGGAKAAILARAAARRINLRDAGADSLSVALDETVTDADLADLLAVFDVPAAIGEAVDAFGGFRRATPFLTAPVFHANRSETQMLRYISRLEAKDLALNTAMIPLGSCTMKLNATTEMIPITFPGFNQLHPFVPAEQARGYARLTGELERWLADITGYDAVSLQPNAGSQGEYAGLLVIRAYHLARGDAHRDVCLIPESAHGTNPASAVMAGFQVVVVRCDDHGNVDVADLRAKAEAHADRVGALMITYPSTHGVFEASIREICEIIHGYGGQVYLDGANLNAMVGLSRPGRFGADVSHLNLHKTFAIPHGGGGPGMGPIGVRAHLAPFLPGHPVVKTGGAEAIGAVSAAPFGSASILPISWAYIALLGPVGLRMASQVAILNANYIAKRLEGAFDILYTGEKGYVAHECIVDFRRFKASAGVEVADVAKRLMDYGFHGPTMSWPVAGTLMIEPTESEPLAEIDRFCDALLAIREEIREIEEGRADRADNVLKNAPHIAGEVCADDWKHAYGREKAAFPTAFTRAHKFWPTVARVDDVWGDRNLCTQVQ
jgi:glycine dehydrogenase